MAEPGYSRPLPRAHRVVGWIAILSFPVVTVLVFAATLLALAAYRPELVRLAQESPVGEGAATGAFTVAVVLGLFGPLGALIGYLVYLRRRYGSCSFEDGFAVISPPFGGVYHLPVAALEQREPTRYGLRVKHPYFGGWLLIPCEGERAAGEVARTLDELARGALEPAVRAGVSAPPEGSRLRLERDYPDELVLSWPLIRAEKVGFSWLFALAMLPLCGAGLLLVPGLLLRERCRNRLRLSPERLALRSGVPVGWGFRCDLARAEVDAVQCADLMLWVRVRGRRRELLDSVALPPADVRWLYALLQAWHAGALRLGPGAAKAGPSG